MSVTLAFGPAVVNLTGVRAGDRNKMSFTITEGGIATNLTGMVVTAQARKRPQATNAVANAVVTLTDPTAGTGELRWDGEEVRTAIGENEKWTGVWDMQVLDVATDPLPVTVVEGTIEFKMDVTRDDPAP